MTAESYQKRFNEIMGGIPEEFQSILSYMAYERGHSAGEDEILRILGSLVYDFRPAIEKFENRIRKEYDGFIPGKTIEEVLLKATAPFAK